MSILERMRNAAERWLGSPRAPWLIGAVALLLTSPSLTTGYEMDDYVLRAGHHGADIAMGSGPADLFVFHDGTSQHRDEGVVGWCPIPP
jgi:hypothetical protein